MRCTMIFERVQFRNQLFKPLITLLWLPREQTFDDRIQRPGYFRTQRNQTSRLLMLNRVQRNVTSLSCEWMLPD